MQNKWQNWGLKKVCPSNELINFVENNINFNSLYLQQVEASHYVDTIPMHKEIFYNLHHIRLQNQMLHLSNLDLRRFHTKLAALMETMQMLDLQPIN
mgnify:CR=1 FL=1